MRILVTGADGFIGSHLTEKLVGMGYKVRALAYYNSFGNNGWLDNNSSCKKLEIISGDIRDPYLCESICRNVDTIFHLAALIAIPYSYLAPHSYVDTNILGTLNILEAARKNNIKKIIHTSTSEVYGTAEYVPIDERHPLKGQSPYSATKIGADQLAASYFYSFGLPILTIRPFNTYGPRQSSRAVIPTIITQILSGKKEILLGALNTTRDFNYIDDTVSGFLSSLQTESAYGSVINIGSNYEISIKNLVFLIADIIGVDVSIKTENKRLRPSKSEVDRLWADNTKAKKILNWSPQFSGIDGLRRGLEKTIEWFSDESNLLNYKIDAYNI
jgi:NAD dependent epimerase/dehydratase